MAQRDSSRPTSNGASIQEIFTNIKRFLPGNDALLALTIVCVAIGSFFLGRLSIDEGVPPRASVVLVSPEKVVEDTPVTTNGDSGTSTVAAPQTVGTYVGSRNGTKYHLPWCSGALRIKEENKVWFATKEEAEKAGYSPAANCKGI